MPDHRRVHVPNLKFTLLVDVEKPTRDASKLLIG